MAAARAITMALVPLWRAIPDERLLGLGYALPYLERFAPDAERALALMPAPQGAVRWPDAPARCRTALVGVDDLPVVDASIDRVLLVHSLEFAENPEDMLCEVWRVLAPGGRVVIVAPNRRGLWTRFEHTPFGSGRPWSRGQLMELLRSASFTPSGFGQALLFPPFRRRSAIGFAGPSERLGRALWPVFAGVLIAEATKQVYRGIPALSQSKARRRVAKPVLVPAGAGARI